LIALQYHEVKLKFTWGTVGGAVNPNVWCDYIYLDTDERRRFAQVSHEYLIEQLQKEDKTTAATTSSNHKLNFNHPVKELIWTYDPDNTMSDINIKLNGHDRFSKQVEEYFTLRQPYDYHTAVPRQNLPPASQHHKDVLLPNIILHDQVASANTASGASTVPENSFIIGGVKLLTNGGYAAATTVDTAVITGQQALVFEKTKAPSLHKGHTYVITFTGTTVNTGANPHIVTVKVTDAATGAAANGAAAKTVGVTNNVYVLSEHSALGLTAAADNGTKLKITSIREKINIEEGGLSEARTSNSNRKIGVYSFALKPEEHQPSGTCNFSRIDNAVLKETSSKNDTLTVYAVNYNVLRIMSGMGGLAYSN